MDASEQIFKTNKQVDASKLSLGLVEYQNNSLLKAKNSYAEAN